MATAIDAINAAASPRRRPRSSFHLAMAVVMTAVLLIGFGYEAPGYIVHPKLARPAIMWVHGIAMFAWMAIYLAQTALVRAGAVRAHRRLGQSALVLAGALFPLMLTAARVMDRFDLVHLPQPDRDAQIAFLAAQLWGALSFAAFVGTSAKLRKWPEFHRRLMFVAMCGLLDAGFGRFPVPWGPVGTQLPEVWAYLAVDVLILIAMLRDWRLIGHVHSAFRIALPLVLAGQAGASYLFIVHPHWWIAAASTLLGVT